MEIHGFVIIVGYQDDGIRVEDSMDSMELIPLLLVKSWQNLRVSLITKAWLRAASSSSSRNMTRIISE